MGAKGALYDMPFAQRLRGLVDEQGKGVCMLGAYIGLSDGALGDYTRGIRMPSTGALVEIAKFFGVSTDYLLGLSDARKTGD
jgi:transcriptional regulator with XRE-family HTH domain